MHLHLLQLQKNMHFLCLVLFSITTPHLPLCIIVVLSYAISVVVSFVAASLSAVVIGNNFLNTLNGIMLQSQSMSTLYGTIIVACLDVFSFAIIAE